MSSTRARRTVRSTFAIILAMLLAVVTGAAASAYANSVTYRGQGLTNDEGTWLVNNEVCGIAEGAESDDPYLLWVLTATGANNADITGPWGKADMTKTGNGTFKYVSGWYDPSTLPGNVSATYDGKAKNAQLVISHGCPPPPDDKGAWCSPGYWKNAKDLAWEKTGYAKTDLFNNTVVPGFYDTASAADPTLIQVLTTPGANTFGAAGPPLGLNAYNATGAFLTDQIPGYEFDPAKIGTPDACPLSNAGNFKPGTTS
jgi:hypothetical protein